jgi:GntR family transcriptional regulator, transcriptional repressor for pyruvate dehydrogenase complex
MSRSRYEEVAERIRTQIADGTLTAGERLPVESALASNFGVSRSTIREALRVLGSEGLIRTTRGVTGGSFVVETGPETLGEYLERRLAMLSGHGAISADELLEARNLLEAAAARLAAARPGTETLAGLRATVDQESGFHVALLAASQNRVLELIAGPVLRLANSAPAVARSGTGDDHARILERIEAGDAEGAANATAEHLGRLNGA